MPFHQFMLAVRNVVRHRRRSALALAAVIFGTSAMLITAGFIEWIFVNFREYSIHSHLGHIQVTRKAFHDGGSPTSRGSLLAGDSGALRLIAGEPHVSLVASRLRFSGLASSGNTTLSFVGEGVEPDKEAALSQAMTISAGQPLSADEPNGAILGEGLAANLGVKPGDRVVLLATTRSGATNAVEVRVRGTFFTVTKAYDDAALRLPLALAQELTRIRGAHSWVVLLQDTEHTGAVLDALRAKLADEDLVLTPWWELADFYNKTVVLFSRQLGAVRLIVGLIIVLSISNTMIMNVLERTWEIGTSRALGVSRRGILVSFLFEGVVLAVAGAACGLALGIGLALLLSAIGIPMPAPPGMRHGFDGGVLVSLPVALQALAIAVGATLAASLYPSFRAARMPIVDALRHNH
jgi:putative ABC transport system permease protein